MTIIGWTYWTWLINKLLAGELFPSIQRWGVKFSWLNMAKTEMQLSIGALTTAHTYHMSIGHNICQGLWDFSQLLSYPDWSGPAPLQSAPVALEYGDLLNYQIDSISFEWERFKWLYKNMYISIREYFWMYLQLVPEELGQSMISHLNRKSFLSNARTDINKTKQKGTLVQFSVCGMKCSLGL